MAILENTDYIDIINSVSSSSKIGDIFLFSKNMKDTVYSFGENQCMFQRIQTKTMDLDNDIYINKSDIRNLFKQHKEDATSVLTYYDFWYEFKNLFRNTINKINMYETNPIYSKSNITSLDEMVEFSNLKAADGATRLIFDSFNIILPKSALPYTKSNTVDVNIYEYENNHKLFAFNINKKSTMITSFFITI